ncbi:hypothetical protein SBY92_004129 [Candida maltosa Xu316]|uniref:Uncharacterized protein n=1 Tax=Candida maltosa (strain Xu316) TaxID=1245528 RepID=M3J9M7_CANMX|nr:hypothetical protein G210_0534 [Candida maltosa Xu316]
MKLVEGLLLKDQLKKEASQLRELISKCCQAQSGDKPPFEVNELFAEYEELKMAEMKVSREIQITNNIIKFKYWDIDEERTMTQALADLSSISDNLYFVDKMIKGGIITYSWSSKEIRDISYVDVVKYQNKLKELRSKEYELKRRIQFANYEFDLIESK